MATKPFLPVLRELARCYQAFEMYHAVHIREIGLTPSQFDIIATLGNTAGMTFKELGEKTLITKGTLTGVVDRLIVKNLVRRVPCAHDGRSQIVQLTKTGEAAFDQVFPEHMAYMSKVFTDFTADDYARIQAALRDFRMAFESTGKSS
ncbi:MAG: MarR family winged helix-turn-helix transcriptional regulator [Burkholderiales bacterium]